MSSTELFDENALLAMFANSVLEVVKLDAVAVVVSGKIRNLLIFHSKITSLGVNFSILSIALYLLFLLWRMKQNLENKELKMEKPFWKIKK